MKDEEKIELKIGDVVRLKSGGPDMTVNGIWEDNKIATVECVWFTNDWNKQMRRLFNLFAVVKVLDDSD